MLLIAWAVLGWGVGTLLEGVALRLGGQHGPTCPGCGRPEAGPAHSALARLLAAAGMRCPGCGSRAGRWLAALGPGLGLLFALLAWRWPPGPDLYVASLYVAVLGLIAVLDLRQRLVYPMLTYPATVAAAVLTPLTLGQPTWSGLLGSLVLGGVLLLFHLVAALLYRGGDALGRGDVMIAALVGAMVGLPGVPAALAWGTLLGGAGALLVGVLQRSRRAHFAYGPALCLGGLIALLGSAGG